MLSVTNFATASKIISLNASFALLGFPGGSAGKESACSAGDLGSIPGLGRSPGERGLTPRGSLECNPEIPAFPGEEN